ncbi:MAG: type II toxin-antitoxin system VapC family toxin [Saprospiraceae bacterium]|nr:type II toxin-antitoxin system VapC family toxin [Saprospiraceae bacterium]HRD80741.1 type II toxin-antitoxin system VapC family toxin [Saprospiraceae bacterium]
MQLLLDTHTFIWYLQGSPELSANAKTAIQDVANISYISGATYWEIAIKINIGKIDLGYPFHDLQHLSGQLGFRWLPIEFLHTVQASSLPLLHRDPFDRMLVAQAQTENLTIITKDISISRYSVPVLW